MLNNKKKSDPFAKGGTTLLAESVEVEGNIKFSGTLEVEGRIEGNIYPADIDSAQINIRATGHVNGEMSAPKIMINGHVTGDVYASSHLELAASAKVTGNVHYSVIEMVKGAQVNGSLVYIDPNQSSRAEAKADAKNAKDVPSKTDKAKAHTA